MCVSSDPLLYRRRAPEPRAAGIAHIERQINRLPLVSVIFLPITFVNGFFGMNSNWMIANMIGAFLALGVALPEIIVAMTVVLLRGAGSLHARARGQRLL